MLAVGSDAPDFSAQDQDGNTVTLSSFVREVGRLMVVSEGLDAGLNAFRATGSVSRRTGVSKRANAVVIGVSFDSVADQKTFADNEGFPYRALVRSGQGHGGRLRRLSPGRREVLRSRDSAADQLPDQPGRQDRERPTTSKTTVSTSTDTRRRSSKTSSAAT